MHVGQHDIRRLAAQGLFDAVGRLWVGHIKMELGDTRDRLHLGDVDGDHPSLPRHQLHALRGDLAPAAWRGAQIDHAHAGPEEKVFVVDLGELEGSARAQPPSLRLLDIRIVELALEPSRRGDLASLGGLDAYRKPTGAAWTLSRTPFRWPYHMLMKPLRRSALTLDLPSPHVRHIGHL